MGVQTYDSDSIVLNQLSWLGGSTVAASLSSEIDDD